MALHLVGDLCAGPNNVMEFVMKENFLSYCRNLISCEVNSEIFKDVCWILGNIALGTSLQLKMLLDSGIIIKLCDFVEKSKADLKVW